LPYPTLPYLTFKVKSLADISNFANHFTSEMVTNLRAKDGEADACDEFSDFSYVAPVSKNLLNSTLSHYGASPFAQLSPKTAQQQAAERSAAARLFAEDHRFGMCTCTYAYTNMCVGVCVCARASPRLSAQRHRLAKRAPTP